MYDRTHLDKIETRYIGEPIYLASDEYPHANRLSKFPIKDDDLMHDIDCGYRKIKIGSIAYRPKGNTTIDELSEIIQHIDKSPMDIAKRYTVIDKSHHCNDNGDEFYVVKLIEQDQNYRPDCGEGIPVITVVNIDLNNYIFVVE